MNSNTAIEKHHDLLVITDWPTQVDDIIHAMQSAYPTLGPKRTQMIVQTLVDDDHFDGGRGVAVHRLAASAFALKYRAEKASGNAVRRWFQEHLGRWGQVYLLPTGTSTPSSKLDCINQGMLVATLILLDSHNLSRTDDWNLLYQVAGSIDEVMRLPSDADDFHSWADVKDSELFPCREGFRFEGSWYAINRRIALMAKDQSQDLDKWILPAMTVLPPGFCLEIAQMGMSPWFKKFYCEW